MINQNQQAVCSRYPADYVTVAFCRDDAAADRFVEHFTAVLRHENIEPRTYD
jgi:predicted RNA-binding protein with PIN domain